MGWTTPYGARMLSWNKFGMIEKGLPYIGDWRDPIYYWWIDLEKKQKLETAINNKSITITIVSLGVYCSLCKK